MSGKKETVLDLGKFIDKSVRVKLSGGREGGCFSPNHLAICLIPPDSLCPSWGLVAFAGSCVSPKSTCWLFAVLGVLKGYDQLLNLVLDETTEFLRGKAWSFHLVFWRSTY